MVDIDSYRGYYYAHLKPTEPHFFVTSLDLYSIRRGLQVFKRFPETITLSRVLISKNMDNREIDYIDKMTSRYPVKWKSRNIFFPFSTEDMTAIYENHLTGRIQVKGLSKTYIDSINFMVEEIFGEDLNVGAVKKAIKVLAKR